MWPWLINHSLEFSAANIFPRCREPASQRFQVSRLYEAEEREWLGIKSSIKARRAPYTDILEDMEAASEDFADGSGVVKLFRLL